MKVRADIVDGIYEVSGFEEGEEILPFNIFYACLTDPEIDTIACDLDKDQVEILSRVYGIKRITE